MISIIATSWYFFLIFENDYVYFSSRELAVFVVMMSRVFGIFENSVVGCRCNIRYYHSFVEYN